MNKTKINNFFLTALLILLAFDRPRRIIPDPELKTVDHQSYNSNQKKNHSLAVAEVLNYEVIDYKLDSLEHETEKGAILYCLQE